MVSAQVICTNCSIPEYEPLDPDKTYKVITTNYVAGGGDGFEVINIHKANYVTGKQPIVVTLYNCLRFTGKMINGCVFYGV